MNKNSRLQKPLRGGRNAAQTRQALIEAATDLFGTRGFDASPIRDIASAADVNIAAIGYHFGGKEGLRRACAEHAADFILSLARRGFAGMREGPGAKTSPDEARRDLGEFVGTIVRGMIVEPRAERIVRFLLREIANPSDSFQIIYSSVIEPTHMRLCRIWASVTGEDAESETVKLGVFAVMGQAVYFRIGTAIVARRMGWNGYGEHQARQIAAEIVANLNSALERHSRSADRNRQGREGSR